MKTSRRAFLDTCGSALAGSAFLTRSAQAAVGTGIFSRYDAQARALLAQMTVDEKIGQMTQPDKMYIQNPDDVATYGFGSVLSGGDSDPKTGNDLISWTEVYDQYQSPTARSRLHIPLIYGVDAVHGHNNVIGATVFPHNIALGCTRNTALIEKAARITAIEVRATGMNWAFAPCVAVPQDIRWGRVYEGYSEDPAIVMPLGAAATKGLQGESLANPLSVAACAKHYIGDGGTSFGSARTGLDQGNTIVDEATLRRLHLPGYVAAVQAGVATIMPSYSSWNGVHCSASKRLLTDLLKDELGFEGFLISDYAAINQLPGNYKQQVQASINAGMDMVMVPDKWLEFIHTLKQLVSEGAVPAARIDDAVLRILRVKIAMGLLDKSKSPLADRSLHRAFGSLEHRAVARDCVRQSIVILKNDGGLLPLRKTSGHIHVAGDSADNIGNQCGGWTVFWQGKTGEDTLGTTILEGIRDAAGSATKITYSDDATGGSGAGIGIAVLGETPYAEMFGDRPDLRLDPKHIALLARMKAAGMRIVVVLISGRPMIIDDLLPHADAVVAAWLPGTEGDGVADVLFGNHKPNGTLSFSWPKASTTDYRVGSAGYQTLFDVGYGLSY
jgi:beta-glucosidase